MNIFKRWVIAVTAIVILIIGITVMTGHSYLFKAVVYNYADIDDYRLFQNDTVKNSIPQPWPVSKRYNTICPDVQLQRQLDSIRTVALVVIKNDSVCFEAYQDGYGSASHSNSFSCAKSIVSILVGIAAGEGHIRSLDDPVGRYFTDFSHPEIGNVTIRQLLMMSSNSNWDESYSGLFSMTTRGYYGTDLSGLIRSLKLMGKPGAQFSYRSGDTQLLALVLQAATRKSLSDYAGEKLWQPIGAEHPALWSLDHKGGIEKAYCCFNSNARDFARLGDLYLHGGNWKGKQLVPEEYVQTSLQPVGLPDESGRITDYYGYQWWLLPERGNIFYARGINGQWIICIPEEHMVIVRLGHLRGKKMLTAHKEVYDMIDWATAAF